MNKVLFMHGGSGNHGCEAISRTTSFLLGGPKNLTLWSNCRDEDIKYGLSDCFEKIVVSEEIRRFSPAYFEAWVRRKLLHEAKANLNVFLRKEFKGNIAISIGGDNYCYPWSAKQAGDLDAEIRKYATKTVLWACSIDEEAITPEVQKDLEKFDLISAREQNTFHLLKEINPNTIQVIDPAFFLQKSIQPLPVGFIENNTVGINVSPLINDYAKNGAIVLDNYRRLIQFILDETSMSVCLIPHVVWAYNNDNEPLSRLYEAFHKSGRVILLQDADCRVLKGYISRCRFFVGARTHSTIAAYSSMIPTLVVGYSTKSAGIAKDLFNTDEKYVIQSYSLESDEDLTRGFMWLVENEDGIKKQLQERIPEYVNDSGTKRAVDIINSWT